MGALKYWIWLTAASNLGPVGINALLDEFGSPENIYFADEGSIAAAAELNATAKTELADKSFDRAEIILENCETAGIGIITIQDADYPDRLKNIHAPPAVLYYKGNIPILDEEAAIAVVGSRKPTPYGIHAAREISYRLAQSGALVVSGMAKGIDGIAHTAALMAGAGTVAILGSGVDVIYPAENRGLYHDIISKGVVLSEYPPQTPAIGSNFPNRNRIISGISLGTLVIEAGFRSGSLITARYAREQGRDVFAAPGNIDVPESEGSNKLIKEGAALVTKAEDILIEYAALFPSKIRLNHLPQPPPPPLPAAGKRRRIKEGPAPNGKKKAFDLTALMNNRPEIQQKLILSVSGQARQIDDILEFTGISAQKALPELTMLEIDGVIRQLPGKYFSLVTDE